MRTLRVMGGLLLCVTATAFAVPFDSAQGKQEPPWNPELKLSMLSCAQQIDTKILPS